MVAVDIARFGAGLELFGLVNTALVWIFVHQLGYLWRDGMLDSPARRWALAAAGLTGLVVVAALPVYPRSMVATVGDQLSHMYPTTAGIATLALFQLGVILLLRPATGVLAAAATGVENRRRGQHSDHDRVPVAHDRPARSPHPVRDGRTPDLSRADRGLVGPAPAVAAGARASCWPGWSPSSRVPRHTTGELARPAVAMATMGTRMLRPARVSRAGRALSSVLPVSTTPGRTSDGGRHMTSRPAAPFRPAQVTGGPTRDHEHHTAAVPRPA